MKRLSALFAVVALALCFGAGQALATGEDTGAAGQTAGQSAGSGQSASGYGGAYQTGPTNSASSIRVLSPGDSGNVTQSNTTTAAAIAANANKTSQGVDQSQAGGGPGSDQTQIAGQEAKNAQSADANATAVQVEPSNTAGSIRVLSPGDNGDVTQSNSAGAGALAANDNTTDQTAAQSQAGGGYGSDGTQIAGQAADNNQAADANATAAQVKPTNTATSIRVLSPGNDGNVTQSNSTTALAAGLNGNATGQSIDQSQGAAPAKDAKAEDAKSAHPSGSSSTQIAGQSADNYQSADANATAVQLKPSNTATSIRVLSPGNDGNVTQSNSTTALGAALNGNETSQSIDQSQGSDPKNAGKAAEAERGTAQPSGSSATQIAGQSADSYQSADANAAAVQVKPSNTVGSIRVLNPGNDGNVTQSNDATAVGIAANGNATGQSTGQSQAGGGPGSTSTQVAGQEAGNYQSADANAIAVQIEPSNTVGSIRVLSPGNDGNVTQSNSTTALGAALNGNTTSQSIDQQQLGKGYGSDSTQVAGQGAWSGQQANADAAAIQLGAKNEYAPVRVGSPSSKETGRKGEHGTKDGKDSHGKSDKSGGSVEQSNSVGALALALNLNETCQSLLQRQAGHGSSLQVAGQGSWSGQGGSADAVGYQGVMPSKK